jgi:hypothetical protein
MSGTLHKLLRQTRQKEITFQHRLHLRQPLLRKFKIKIHVQSIHKLGNRIGILISLLLDDSNELTNLFLVVVRISFAEMGCYDCGGEIAKDPGWGGLNGVYVGGGEEEFAEGFAAVFGVKEGEEGPMDEPGAVVELECWVGEGLISEPIWIGGTLSLMISLTLLSSSIAPSQFPEMISAANLPHVAAVFRATSVERIRKLYNTSAAAP